MLIFPAKMFFFYLWTLMWLRNFRKGTRIRKSVHREWLLGRRENGIIDHMTTNDWTSPNPHGLLADVEVEPWATKRASLCFPTHIFLLFLEYRLPYVLLTEQSNKVKRSNLQCFQQLYELVIENYWSKTQVSLINSRFGIEPSKTSKVIT
jgi:hypothetical protein